jgi:hypothetical protein
MTYQLKTKTIKSVKMKFYYIKGLKESILKF